MFCFLGADSKMDRQRRLRMAQLLRPSVVPPASPNPQSQSATTPSIPLVQASSHQPPSSPLPIAPMPLALGEAAAPSAPLDKGKRVVVVTDDDEDLC